MNNVRIIKKQPYPFSALLTKTQGSPVIRGQVLKLTEIGFLVQVNHENFFVVGENHFVEFDVPSTHVTVKSPIKVIKTYDIMTEPPTRKAPDANERAQAKVYTVEMHFRALEDEAKKAIQFFIQKIGQK